MRFVTIEEVIAIYEAVIQKTGGRVGIRDFLLLHSSIERPKATFAGKDLYSTIWDKAAALIHSLILNHPFEDGNKRTGLLSARRFLAKNGYDLKPHPSAVQFTLDIDRKRKNLTQIARWLKNHRWRI